MAETTEASVLYGPRDIRINPLPLPPPSADELQVAVKATTLCGSDVHYYNDFRIGDTEAKEALTLGHESAGIVVAVGENGGDWAVGDRVALEVGVPCETCILCEEGRYNICRGLRFRSSARSLPHYQGTLQHRINHPAQWCHRLPEGLPLELGALAEPLSVAIHTVQRAELPRDANILILGAGPIGMLCAMVCGLSQPRYTKMVDICKERLEFAEDQDFVDSTCHLTHSAGHSAGDPSEIAKHNAAFIDADTSIVDDGDITDHLVRGGYDAVFECTGKEVSAQTAIYKARAGGRVVLVGLGPVLQALPVGLAITREIDIIGSFRYAGNYPQAITLLSDHKTVSIARKISKLITHEFAGLESVTVALDVANRTFWNDTVVLKVLIWLDAT